SILLGGNYNKQAEVSAGDRDFSKFALYLYRTSSGAGSKVSAQHGGSSRNVTGRVGLPAGNPIRTALGCSSVTRKDGATGTSPADFRCFTAGDLYHYQPLNLLMTPQERGSLFTLANYKINDSLESYVEVVYNHTRSGFQLAALPFDARADDSIVSKDNFYNPFGIDFGGISGINPNAQYRLEALGTRSSQVQTDQALANLGLRGEIGQSGWQWDLTAGLGRMQQDTNISGYLLKSKVGNAVGPSGPSAVD